MISWNSAETAVAWVLYSSRGFRAQWVRVPHAPRRPGAWQKRARAHDISAALNSKTRIFERIAVFFSSDAAAAVLQSPAARTFSSVGPDAFVMRVTRILYPYGCINSRLEFRGVGKKNRGRNK